MALHVSILLCILRAPLVHPFFQRFSAFYPFLVLFLKRSGFLFSFRLIQRYFCRLAIIKRKGNFSYLIDSRHFLLSVWTERRNKKEPRTRSHRRTNGLSGVWLRNSRLRRSDSPRPRRHRKASFVTDGSRYRSPC